MEDNAGLAGLAGATTNATYTCTHFITSLATSVVSKSLTANDHRELPPKTSLRPDGGWGYTTHYESTNLTYGSYLQQERRAIFPLQAMNATRQYSTRLQERNDTLQRMCGIGALLVESEAVNNLCPSLFREGIAEPMKQVQILSKPFGCVSKEQEVKHVRQLQPY